MVSAQANQPSAALPADAQTWLSARGAVFARVDADGVIEFSARPIGDALTDAVAGLLPTRSGAARVQTVRSRDLLLSK